MTSYILKADYHLTVMGKSGGKEDNGLEVSLLHSPVSGDPSRGLGRSREVREVHFTFRRFGDNIYKKNVLNTDIINKREGDGG